MTTHSNNRSEVVKPLHKYSKISILISTGSFVSAILLGIILSTYPNGDKFEFIINIFVGIWWITLIGGLVGLASSSAKRVAILVLAFIFILLGFVVFTNYYKESLPYDKTFWIFWSVILLSVSCIVIENLYQLTKKSIGKIVKMDTKDILTIIVVPIATFLLGKVL